MNMQSSPIGNHAPPTSTTGRRVARVAAAGLAVTVAGIHIVDQGGPTALKDPAYLGYGFWMLELAGVICAIALLTRDRPSSWILATGVAAGPLVGITISRAVGLPAATDDIGNWFEPIGMLAMAVEMCLLVLAIAALTRTRRATRTT